MFCKEAVIWARLTHENILPLLGVTIDPPQLVSNWMTGGDLPGYVRRRPGADLLRLVGVCPVVFIPRSFPLPVI